MLTRRSLLTSLFAASALAPLGVAALPSEAQAQAQAQPRPNRAPPPPRREQRPPPRRGYTWIPGHWSWDSRRGWVWNAGFQDRNRSGHRFSGPRWVLRRGQWVYDPGRWVRAW